VALDRYKTQVLLLHSEQSTLDKFSTGFDDRYTVHCATSGTEALTTLGETPIHVIVSAHKLPGMSGAEALREAKKRSPETIGILLAGDSSEAVVGEKEVFQVIRGGVDPSELRRLIDNATQQSRLFALAESANDTRALPDEPVSEHIIMETSENGSSIITDATGQLPALDPKKISSSAAVGAATVDVLVITKDQEFLSTIKESSRGVHTVHYANTLKQAEEAVRKNKVGVAVVDAAMVGENVEKLTEHLRNLTKRLVAIVAGRRDDGEMLMDLINRGKVYRFLLKPVSPGRARLAVEASVKHHLEAPDSAFTSKGKAAAPAPAPKAKPQPEKKPSAPAKPATKKPQPAETKKPPKPPVSIKATKNDSLAGKGGLDDAFGDDSSFTETMTGIVSTVTKSISGKKKDKDAKSEKVTPLPAELGDGAGESSFNPKLIGIGAAAVVAIAAIGFWVFGGSDDADVSAPKPAATSSVRGETPGTGGASQPTSADVDELLEEARLARDAGQIYNPPGNNAIELYVAAVSAAPDNAYAAAELDATLDETLSMAEAALLERRADDAAAALERVSQANPDHPRLPFLTAQASQMQLRNYMDSARAAIREQRLEDAAAAIANARSLDIADDGEIAVVEEELLGARSAQRVDEVLAVAGQRLEDGALTSPANDNARYYYQLALSNDPGNAAAQTGLSVVASKIVLQAREEIDGGRFNTAEALLAEARELDPQSAELAASTKALSDARARVERDRQRAERERQAAAERREAEKRAEEQRQAAAREAEERRAAEAAAAAAATAAAAAAAATESVTDTPASGQDTAAAITEPAETAEPVAEEATAPAEASEPVPANQQAPVAASTLNRTKYVAPRYPRSAERRSISGWVDVVFTVRTDGTVTDVEVVGSEPGDTFVDAATRAVGKWEFEPVVEDGQVVEKRAGVRMTFAIQ
jgi:TonB family protein